MKRLLASALLLGIPLLLCAQGPAPEQGLSASPSAPARAAFELKIDAPEEIQTLLAQHLELLRYRELTDLSDSEINRLMTQAQQNTQELVATLGYFAPEISIKLQAANSAAAARVVHLSVKPGEPTLVSEVHVTLSGAIANEAPPNQQGLEIEKSWLLQPGMRFTQAGWMAAKQHALRQLITHRYPTGQLVSTLADIDPITRSARLNVTLDSGPAYQLGALFISGTERYDPELVTRLARITPGVDYDQAQLVAAQQRLTDSGFFDSALISLDTTGDPAAAPVRVQLREARLQKLVFGIGASTDSGARLSAEHTHQKVPGIGWRAVSKLMLDRETRSLGSELTAPPDTSNWRWVTSVLLQNQHLGDADVTSQRLRLGRSQNGEQIDRNYYLQYDRAQSASMEGTLPVVAEAMSVNYAVTRRNFDSLPFPSRGWGVGAEIGGGSTLGSQQDPYGRVLARGLYYLPLDREGDTATTSARHGRIALRAEVGAVLAQDGIALPSTQLFLTGGDKTVRGYAFQDIGVKLADGQTTPGRYMANGSIEWQHPITAKGRLTDWESTVFLDAGAVADKPGDLQAKVGVGVGARWKSPVGPLQIDLAYGVDVQRLRLHLNVGFTF